MNTDDFDALQQMFRLLGNEHSDRAESRLQRILRKVCRERTLNAADDLQLAEDVIAALLMGIQGIGPGTMSELQAYQLCAALCNWADRSGVANYRADWFGVHREETRFAPTNPADPAAGVELIPDPGPQE